MVVREETILNNSILVPYLDLPQLIPVAMSWPPGSFRGSQDTDLKASTERSPSPAVVPQAQALAQSEEKSEKLSGAKPSPAAKGLVVSVSVEDLDREAEGQFLQEQNRHHLFAQRLAALASEVTPSLFNYLILTAQVNSQPPSVSLHTARQIYAQFVAPGSPDQVSLNSPHTAILADVSCQPSNN